MVPTRCQLSESAFYRPFSPSLSLSIPRLSPARAPNIDVCRVSCCLSLRPPPRLPAAPNHSDWCEGLGGTHCPLSSPFSPPLPLSSPLAVPISAPPPITRVPPKKTQFKSAVTLERHARPIDPHRGPIACQTHAQQRGGEAWGLASSPHRRLETQGVEGGAFWALSRGLSRCPVWSWSTVSTEID